jgi:hypothetical protein
MFMDIKRLKAEADILSQYWEMMVDQYSVPNLRQWVIWQNRYTTLVIEKAIDALSLRLQRRGLPHMDRTDKHKYASGCMRNIAAKEAATHRLELMRQEM